MPEAATFAGSLSGDTAMRLRLAEDIIAAQEREIAQLRTILARLK